MQQGELSLSFPATTTPPPAQLERVGELFPKVHSSPAILLDGLDEVQVNRAHLVRLVQDFVAGKSLSGRPSRTRRSR
jgi:hypothetical protein